MVEDNIILDLLNRSDEKGIKLIFDQYYRYLCHAVYKVIPDTHIVEDLVQEVFYEIWKKRERLQINISLKAYLRRASINKSLNYVRAQRMKFSDNEDIKERFVDDDNSHEKVELSELTEVINQAVESLPERCRLVFSLSRFESMSYKEIAEQLGISMKTVENQISKALKILRKEINIYHKS